MTPDRVLAALVVGVVIGGATILWAGLATVMRATR